MYYDCTTQVPNALFDTLLTTISNSELRILLVIIRQTVGWIDKKTGKRKLRDRISSSQFMKKTGLSKRSICSAIASLQTKGYIKITGFKGNDLNAACNRKGKYYLYYSTSLTEYINVTSANNGKQPVQKRMYNKTNYTKPNPLLNKQKFTGHIKELLPKGLTI